MSRIAQVVFATIAALTSVAAPAWAQGSDQSRSDNSMDQTIKAMQDELQRLRQDNAQMKDQIDDLRAKTDDNWLTEARANEIRGLVQDVLADADSRANLLDDGIMAGWSEHFFLADAFGRFLLQFEGMTQIRYVYSFRDQPDRNIDGFEVTRTRLTFRGHVYNEDLQYLVRTEATPYPHASGTAPGAFSLLDVWIRYNLTNDWSVRAGQFKLPFTREELVSESEQLAVEQSLLNVNFTTGRSIGVELDYHDNANAWMLAFSDGLSSRGGQSSPLQVLFGGPRLNTSAQAPNVEYAVTTRYERLLAGTWNQFEDFTSPVGDEYGMLFGIAAHAQNNESFGTPFIGSNEQRGIGVTTDLSIEWGGASAFVTGTYWYVDSPTIGIIHMVGVMGQVGVYLAPKWEVYARAEWMQLETAGGAVANIPDAGIGTIGVNYYIEGHDVKWTTDVGFSTTALSQNWTSQTLTGYRSVTQGGEPEIVFRSQIQLVF